MSTLSPDVVGETPTRSTTGRFRTAAILSLASQVMIVITGAAVRLTGSGLGCSDWPTCDEDRLVPEAEFHGLIEFTNRTLSAVVIAAMIFALVAAYRVGPSARRYVRLGWVVVGLVVANVVLGGITVLTHLRPEVVMAHFLLSIALIAIAVVIAVGANQLHREVADHVVDQRVARHAGALAAWTGLVVFVGTIVTAAGPHAGDEDVERLGVAVRTAARTHAVLVWVLVGLLVMTFVALGKIDANHDHTSFRRHLSWLTVAVVVQGTIGYVQYFGGTPALLVGIHIAGSIAVWMAAVRLAMHPSRPSSAP